MADPELKIKDVQYLALTATAPPSVLRGICEALYIAHNNVVRGPPRLRCPPGAADARVP